MLKHMVLSAAVVALVTSGAVAQTGPAPPVGTMNCAQMQAEMTVAGQRMSAQLDPEFATEAQAMHDEAQAAQRPSVATGIGASIACSIPGVGLGCMAAQQAQVAQAQRDAAQNQARMQAQMNRLDQSMEGIDQDRMMAMSQRYEAMNCQAAMQQ
ncbi:MAG: hypothetical protein H7124_09225 [Phycisphaerales bacterium]|nr:hypothetical protein [Hyphomonadaceae bacterium]